MPGFFEVLKTKDLKKQLLNQMSPNDSKEIIDQMQRFLTDLNQVLADEEAMESISEGVPCNKVDPKNVGILRTNLSKLYDSFQLMAQLYQEKSSDPKQDFLHAMRQIGMAVSRDLMAVKTIDYTSDKHFDEAILEYMDVAKKEENPQPDEDLQDDLWGSFDQSFRNESMINQNSMIPPGLQMSQQQIMENEQRIRQMQQNLSQESYGESYDSMSEDEAYDDYDVPEIEPPKKKEKTGDLQIMSLVPITDQIMQLVPDHCRERFTKMQLSLQVTVNMLTPHSKKGADRMSVEDKSNILSEYNKALGHIRLIKQTHNLRGDEAQELNHYLQIAQKKMEDDIHVLTGYSVKDDLYRTVQSRSRLSNHYGLRQDQKTVVSKYDLYDGGLENVNQLVNKMYKALDDADPVFMLTGSDEYTAMKTAVKSMQKWLQTYQKCKGKVDASDSRVSPRQFMRQVEWTMDKVGRYLNHKESDFAQDLQYGIIRSQDPGKEKYEQPRIRAALHVYDDLTRLSRMSAGVTPDEYRESTVQYARETLLSENSKKLYAQENGTQVARPQTRQTPSL